MGDRTETKVMPCSCKHAYQDQKYGPGMRLWNFAKKAGWRCTVCGVSKG